MQKKLVPFMIFAAFAIVFSAHAKDDAIQCANLIYAGNNTSRCFSDEFLSTIQRKTAIATERRFRSVKLASDELFQYPFIVMTGESDFFLSKKEKGNLKKYLESGGFLLASAGCSNDNFNRAFRREMKSIFKDKALKKLAQDHAIFNNVYKIEKLELGKSDGTAQLEGLEINNKIVVIYSPEGLNDTSHTSGCCCCGGNEIRNAMQVNVNILIYALTH